MLGKVLFFILDTLFSQNAIFDTLNTERTFRELVFQNYPFSCFLGTRMVIWGLLNFASVIPVHRSPIECADGQDQPRHDSFQERIPVQSLLLASGDIGTSQLWTLLIMDSQLLTVEVPKFWLLPLTFYIIGYLFGLTMELVLIFKSTGPGPYAHPCWSPWT